MKNGKMTSMWFRLGICILIVFDIFLLPIAESIWTNLIGAILLGFIYIADLVLEFQMSKKGIEAQIRELENR